MGLALITAPAVEPVTLTEAKTQCRVDGSTEDTFLTSLIVAAREAAEAQTGRALINQTWERTLDAFPRRWNIYLPFPPLVSVTHIKYIDADGVLQTLASTGYKVLTTRTPGEVCLSYNNVWPSTRCEEDAVTVRYVAGYGATAASVPQLIKQGILLTINHWYDNREAEELPAAAVRLFDMLRVVGFPK